MNICIDEVPVEQNIYRRQNENDIYSKDVIEFMNLIGRSDIADKFKSIGITKLGDLVDHKLRDWIDFDDNDDDDLFGIHCCIMQMGLKCTSECLPETALDGTYYID